MKKTQQSEDAYIIARAEKGAILLHANGNIAAMMVAAGKTESSRMFTRREM